ncbi:MAG: LUD domain-containing protein, partial [Planctomycetota bacterium]
MNQKDFYDRTEKACTDTALAQKLHAATDRQRQAREEICDELGDVEAFREQAASLRDEVLRNLDRYLGRFVDLVQKSGVKVHWAKDAEEACRIVCEIADQYQVKRIVKSKSMITEEIALTPALESTGREVVETDLGEFIIQLAKQPPSHIVLPAVHLSAGDVFQIFKDKIGYRGSPDAHSMTRAARK